jgi:hypothetical protein
MNVREAKDLRDLRQDVGSQHRANRTTSLRSRVRNTHTAAGEDVGTILKTPATRATSRAIDWSFARAI